MKFENINYTLNNVKEIVQLIGSREEDLNKIIKLAQEQIKQSFDNFENEKQLWFQKQKENEEKMDLEMQKLTQNYAQEIVQVCLN